LSLHCSLGCFRLRVCRRRRTKKGTAAEAAVAVAVAVAVAMAVVAAAAEEVVVEVVAGPTLHFLRAGWRRRRRSRRKSAHVRAITYSIQKSVVQRTTCNMSA
jgi:hypothetical protein